MMSPKETLIGEQFLKANQEKRRKMMNVIPKDNEYMDGDFMRKIMDRKKARVREFQENKKARFEERFGMTYADLLAYSTASDLDWRRAIKEGKILGDFAGEDMSFPIASKDDVRRAWASIGRTKQDRKKVMKNIIRIAKKYGWEDGLPQTVKDRLEAGKSGLP
jgi:hypothetical protein